MGPLTLITPQWIPGTHRPTPLVDSITGVVFTANGETLAWRRDNVNMFEYHVDIPKGVTSLHAHLDLINPGRQTTHLAAFEWEGLLLYPAGIPVAKIAVEPSVTVPKGWGRGHRPYSSWRSWSVEREHRNAPLCGLPRVSSLKTRRWTQVSTSTNLLSRRR